MREFNLQKAVEESNAESVCFLAYKIIMILTGSRNLINLAWIKIKFILKFLTV